MKLIGPAAIPALVLAASAFTMVRSVTTSLRATLIPARR